MLRRRVAGLAAALLAGAMQVTAAAADPPAATVPDNLQGTWGTFFGSLGPITVRLQAKSATLSSERKETLGYLAGAFSASDPMKLKVLWDLPAFQQNPAKALPALVWPDAMLDKGDPAYPGYVATDLSLRYDADHDQLVGTYSALNIEYKTDTNKYDKTLVSSVDIRLTRPESRGYLKITGAQAGKEIDSVDVGDRFWLELKPPKGDALESAGQVEVTLNSDDSTYGTKSPVTLTLAKAGAVFRGPADGVLVTPAQAKATEKFVTIYADAAHAEQAKLHFYTSVKIKDYSWDNGAESERFTLSTTTPGTVEIAPDKSDHVGVKLQNSAKQPIPAVTINWQFRNVNVTSLTNPIGVAEIYFSLRPEGDYAVWADGAPVPNVTLPAGTQQITATVAGSDFASLVDGSPQTLTVNLQPRLTVAFLNRERGATIDKLFPKDAFQLEVHGLPSADPMPEEIEVALKSTTDSTTMTLYRYPKEVSSSAYYLSEAALTATDYRLMPIFVSGHIEVKPGTRLTATYQGTSVSIPMYASWVQDELAQIRAALEFFAKLLAVEQQAALTPDQAARVKARLQLIDNANSFLNSNAIFDSTKVFIGAAYLDLLGQEPYPLDPSQAVNQTITTPLGGTIFSNFAFGTPGEAAAVNGAIAKAQQYKIDQLTGLPSAIATATYNGVKSIPATLGGMVTGIVTAPIYGGYTLGTGLTLDGQRASTFQRVMGGVDVLIGAATVLSVAYPRARALLQGSEAGRMRAAAEGRALLDVPGLQNLTEAEMMRVNGGANVRGLFEQALRTPAFMDIPGAVQALNDLASGTANKVIGAAFAIRCVLAELATGEVRLVEDWLAGKQAADLVRRNGDVVQYKSYGKKSLSKLWKDIMEQGESDVRRYAANGWVDRLGGKLSGNFEFHFDAQKLLNGGVAQAKIDLFAEEASKWLTAKLNGASLGQYGTPGGSITYKVVAHK